jgi:PKD repeat protein
MTKLSSVNLSGLKISSINIFSDFIGTPLSGSTPLSVDFTDLSMGGATAWNWTFGDGNTSSLQNPSHTYILEDPYWDLVILGLHGDGTNGSTVIIDSSDVANPMTVTGTGTSVDTSSPKFGTGALGFQGTGLITCPLTSALQLNSGPWSFSFWVKTSQTGNAGLFTSSLTSSNGYGIRLSAGQLQFIRDGTVFRNFGVVVNDGNWHYISASYDEIRLKLYVDGTRVSNDLMSAIPTSSSTDFVLGKSFLNEFFIGQIDDLEITNGVARWSDTTQPVPTVPFVNSLPSNTNFTVSLTATIGGTPYNNTKTAYISVTV